MMRGSIVVLLTPFMLLPALGQTETPHPVGKILDEGPRAWWGAMIVDAATGDVIYERNADHSFMPASVTKIFTTAAVLDQLGPDYRYKTRVYADGRIDAGKLDGNLIVRGAGDPSVGAPGEDHLALFDAWADSLIALGVREISGNIVGDDNVFDDTPLGADWSWDDAIYGYAAPTSGLTYHENVIELTVHATTPGMPGTVVWTPETDHILEVHNNSATLPRGERLRPKMNRSLYSRALAVESKVPVGRTDQQYISVTNPTLFFAEVLLQHLEVRDISVGGGARDIDDLSKRPSYDSLEVVARHYSAPLSELAAVTNKESHNLYAEHLLRTLGVEQPVADSTIEPGSAAMGRQAAMRTFAAARADTMHLQLVDGSGLSRRNLISPRMAAAVLQYMREHEDSAVRSAFDASLAVGGIDGTLEYRFPKGQPAHGVVRAKTGTIGNVSSLAGYVQAASGREYVFVLICNHFIAPYNSIRNIQDRVVNLVARSH